MLMLNQPAFFEEQKKLMLTKNEKPYLIIKYKQKIKKQGHGQYELEINSIYDAKNMKFTYDRSYLDYNKVRGL
jgi:hypothetical protein